MHQAEPVHHAAERRSSRRMMPKTMVVAPTTAVPISTGWPWP